MSPVALMLKARTWHFYLNWIQAEFKLRKKNHYIMFRTTDDSVRYSLLVTLSTLPSIYIPWCWLFTAAGSYFSNTLATMNLKFSALMYCLLLYCILFSCGAIYRTCYKITCQHQFLVVIFTHLISSSSHIPHYRATVQNKINIRGWAKMK